VPYFPELSESAISASIVSLNSKAVSYTIPGDFELMGNEICLRDA
jgi:hypothetical protein